MATDHAARSDQAGPEPSPESWWVPVIAYQDDIAFEIDQVAIRSAECEMHVREVLVSLAGDHDRSWILFEGQGQRGSMPMNVDTRTRITRWPPYVRDRYAARSRTTAGSPSTPA